MPVYSKAKKKFFDADIDWLVDDIRVVLLDGTEYAPALTVHEFLSDVPLGARLGMSDALTGKSDAGGVLDADDATVPAVSGSVVSAYVLVKYTGTDATSPLIQHKSFTPQVPPSGPMTLRWDNGLAKIFSYQ